VVNHTRLWTNLLKKVVSAWLQMEHLELPANGPKSEICGLPTNLRFEALRFEACRNTFLEKKIKYMPI